MEASSTHAHSTRMNTRNNRTRTRGQQTKAEEPAEQVKLQSLATLDKMPIQYPQAGYRS